MPDRKHAPRNYSSDLVLQQIQPNGQTCRAKLLGGSRALAQCLMADGAACPYAFHFGNDYFCRLAVLQAPKPDSA